MGRLARDRGWFWSEPILLLGMYNYGYTTRREQKTTAIFFCRPQRVLPKFHSGVRPQRPSVRVRIWLRSYSEPASHASYFEWIEPWTLRTPQIVSRSSCSITSRCEQVHHHFDGCKRGKEGRKAGLFYDCEVATIHCSQGAAGNLKYNELLEVWGNCVHPFS